MQNRYKLLVADIDGTLVDKNGSIAAEDKSALAKAINSGVQVSLSTGRVTQSALIIINQLSLDGYHIFFDGALVSDPKNGDEVYVKPISANWLKQIVEFAHQKKMDIDFYSGTHYFIERETWSTEIRRQFFGLQPTIIDFSQLWPRERIIKGTLVVSSAEERAKADSFYQQFKGSLSFSWSKTPAYPEIDFINIVAATVSKGQALEALTSHLRIPLAEVIAIGDGINDIPLLSKAGLAVAMGNAPDKLKAIADFVTLDIDHHGVAAAIEKFLM